MRVLVGVGFLIMTVLVAACGDKDKPNAQPVPAPQETSYLNLKIGDQQESFKADQLKTCAITGQASEISPNVTLQFMNMEKWNSFYLFTGQGYCGRESMINNSTKIQLNIGNRTSLANRVDSSDCRLTFECFAANDKIVKVNGRLVCNTFAVTTGETVALLAEFSCTAK